MLFRLEMDHATYPGKTDFLEAIIRMDAVKIKLHYKVISTSLSQRIHMENP